MQRRIRLLGPVAIAAATALLAPDAGAEAFVGVTAGSAQWPGDACSAAGGSCDRNETAWSFKAGVSPVPLLSIEARYFDLGSSHGAYGAGVGAGLAVPIAPFFAVTALAGVARVRAESGGSRTTSQPYYGLGVRFTFAPNLDASLEAQRYRAEFASGGKADVDVLGVGLTYRF